MIYLMQLIKMLDRDQRNEFCLLFSDPQYLVELNDGTDFKHILEMELWDTFGIELASETQLEQLSESLFKNHAKLGSLINFV